MAPRKRASRKVHTQLPRRPISLRTARKIARLTQRELGERAGVDHSFISLLEDGKRDLRLVGFEIVTRIAWALHITPDELVPIARDGAPAAEGDGGSV